MSEEWVQSAGERRRVDLFDRKDSGRVPGVNVMYQIRNKDIGERCARCGC